MCVCERMNKSELRFFLNIEGTRPYVIQCCCVQFAGRWYRVGLAYDSPSFVPYRDKVKASMGVITVLPSGNVNLTMWDAT